MRTALFLAFAAFALAAAPVPAAQDREGAGTGDGRPARPALPPPVTLIEHAVVEGDVVRLGDLFRGLEAQADIAIARAPALGRRVELNARWLAHLARGHDLPWRPSSTLDRAVVERASRAIGSARIEAALLDALARRGHAGDIVLSLDSPDQSLAVPAEWVSDLEIAGLRFDPGNGRFTAKLRVGATGQAPIEAVVTGRALEMTEVPVLARQVRPGAVIRDGDIHWRRMRLDKVAGNVALDPEGIVGKSPRRPIRVERPIRVGDLREPVVVPKNSLVTIRLRGERMVLTARGRAMEDGVAGGAVKVMNTKSNSIVHAVAVRPGIVEVAGAPSAEAGGATRD